MDLHIARHVSASLILAADANGWAEAAAVANVSVATLRAHYAWFDDRKACAAGRNVLRQQRSASRKHRKGSFADD